MAWWQLLQWTLRALLGVAVLMFVYLGVVGGMAALDTSEDGGGLALVVGGMFLFLAAIAFWWLYVEMRRD